MGVVCGPILDITYSPHYNLMENRVIFWWIFMMEERRVRSFLVAPPCTTFSLAAHPSLRSYAKPEGYDPYHPRVMVGNLLASAALLLLYVGLRLRIFGLGEQPRRSKMRWLRQWRRFCFPLAPKKLSWHHVCMVAYIRKNLSLWGST